MGWFAIAFPAVVRAGICNLFMLPAMARLLFTQGLRGIFNVHQLMPADEAPSVTSVRGTAHTLMNDPACGTPG